VDRDFTLAVIGTGYWGRKHVDEYIKLGYKVVAVDLLEENREYIKKKYGVEVTDSLDRVLNDSKILGVSICTPNTTHFELAKTFLDAGKNVLLEKPLTLDSKSSWELVKIAKEKGIILAVGHIYRFNNAVQYAKDLLESGKLGKIYLAKLTWTNLEPVFENRDILFDLGPHPFDILDYLLDANFEYMGGAGSCFRKERGDEAVFITAKSKSTLFNIELSWVTPKKTRELLIVGEHGTLEIDAVRQKVRQIYGNGGSGENVYIPEIIANNTIQDELYHFVKCSLNNKIEHADGSVGAKIVEVLERVQATISKT